MFVFFFVFFFNGSLENWLDLEEDVSCLSRSVQFDFCSLHLLEQKNNCMYKNIFPCDVENLWGGGGLFIKELFPFGKAKEGGLKVFVIVLFFFFLQ